jgi:hypothetical protein
MGELRYGSTMIIIVKNRKKEKRKKKKKEKREKKGTCMLMDVAISGDRNVIKKEAENILKYEDFIIEIQRMWIVRAKKMPVIIGATGTISKSPRLYLNNVLRKHEIKEL